MSVVSISEADINIPFTLDKVDLSSVCDDCKLPEGIEFSPQRGVEVLVACERPNAGNPACKKRALTSIAGRSGTSMHPDLIADGDIKIIQDKTVGAAAAVAKCHLAEILRR